MSRTPPRVLDHHSWLISTESTADIVDGLARASPARMTLSTAFVSDASRYLEHGWRQSPSTPPSRQVSYLNKMSDMVRGQLTKIERNKLVALITMEIHNRCVSGGHVAETCRNIVK